jgi:hypothetical protein
MSRTASEPLRVETSADWNVNRTSRGDGFLMRTRASDDPAGQPCEHPKCGHEHYSTATSGPTRKSPKTRFSPFLNLSGRLPLFVNPAPELRIAHWFPVLIIVALVVIPWIQRRKRFSLRSLLIATTLIAIALGVVVWTVGRKLSFGAGFFCAMLCFQRANARI